MAGSDAVAVKGAAAEDSSTKMTPVSAAAESIPSADVAPAPISKQVSEQASQEVSESSATADGGETASHSPEHLDPLPAATISVEQASTEPSAPPDSNLAPEKPAARQVESAPARQPEAAQVIENGAGDRAIRPPAKARPAAARPRKESAAACIRAFWPPLLRSLPAAPRAWPRQRTSPPRRKRRRPSERPCRMQRIPCPLQGASKPPSAPAQLQPPLPAASRENAPLSPSSFRQSQTPATPRWDKMQESHEHAPRRGADTGVSGAQDRNRGSRRHHADSAGARGRRTVAANPRAGHGSRKIRPASNLASGGPEFQVEVADLNNRRWVLKSGGDAGSPFNDAPTRRDAQAAAAASARSEAAKASSRSADSADSSNAPDTPQPRTAKPRELALARPLVNRVAGPPAQILAPSIFDGITPPIGSLTDRLPVTGPAAPGTVAPQSQPGIGTTTLQSAILLQRVSPVYPLVALRDRVTGEVRVSATIGKDGVPRNLAVVSGDLRLVQAAMTAISQWRYRPATLDGQPIDMPTTVSVSFQMAN